MSSLGKRLRAARDRKNYSQVKVYKLTGINNKTLSRYENDGTEPDADSLKKLADLYEVTTDWLLGLTTNKVPKKVESEYSLPESEYDRVIKEAEEKYGVDLRDDPNVHQMMRELILGIAKMQQDKK